MDKIARRQLTLAQIPSPPPKKRGLELVLCIIIFVANKKGGTDTERVYCRNCKNITNHEVLLRTKVANGNEEIFWEYTYKTIQCLGCETVCLLEEYFFSEDIDPYTGQPELQVKIYPDPSLNREELPEIYFLPEKIRKAYRETISAFNQKLSILTGVGLRIIIEAICKDNGATQHWLKDKIDALVEMGLMTKKEAELLHLNRYIGNAATHDIIEPPIEELKTGLDIVEAILQNAYILPKKAFELKEKYNEK